MFPDFDFLTFIEEELIYNVVSSRCIANWLIYVCINM